MVDTFFLQNHWKATITQWLEQGRWNFCKKILRTITWAWGGYVTNSATQSCPLLDPVCVTLRLPHLDSETGWTGDFWSNNGFLKYQNKEHSICFLQKKSMLNLFGFFYIQNFYIYMYIWTSWDIFLIFFQVFW